MLKRFNLPLLFCTVWLLATAGGFAVILNYQQTDGAAETKAGQWPPASQIIPATDRYTLLLFAHPRCPCTRATMTELNRLLASCGGKVAAQVWFAKPSDAGSDWNHTGLWQTAASLPGVTVHEDLDGLEASRFGAKTSGFVLLYDTAGKLLFSGGITEGRGHEGDNAGESALISRIVQNSTILTHTPVYGCALPSACPVKEARP